VKIFGWQTLVYCQKIRTSLRVYMGSCIIFCYSASPYQIWWGCEEHCCDYCLRFSILLLTTIWLNCQLRILLKI